MTTPIFVANVHEDEVLAARLAEQIHWRLLLIGDGIMPDSTTRKLIELKADVLNCPRIKDKDIRTFFLRSLTTVREVYNPAPETVVVKTNPDTYFKAPAVPCELKHDQIVACFSTRYWGKNGTLIVPNGGYIAATWQTWNKLSDAVTRIPYDVEFPKNREGVYYEDFLIGAALKDSPDIKLCRANWLYCVDSKASKSNVMRNLATDPAHRCYQVVHPERTLW